MQDKFGVRSLKDRDSEMMAALYLQVSIISQALIFVTRSRSWSFVERPGFLLLTAFVLAQLVSFYLRRGIYTLFCSSRRNLPCQTLKPDEMSVWLCVVVRNTFIVFGISMIVVSNSLHRCTFYKISSFSRN